MSGGVGSRCAWMTAVYQGLGDTQRLASQSLGEISPQAWGLPESRPARSPFERNKHMRSIIVFALLFAACTSPQHKSFKSMAEYKPPTKDDVGLMSITPGVEHRIWKTPKGYGILVWSSRDQKVEMKFSKPMSIQMKDSGKLIKSSHTQTLTFALSGNPVMVYAE